MEGRSEDAAIHFERATELDPEFATAYMLLAFAYQNALRYAEAETAIERAYALRNQLGEHERLEIEATRFLFSGELDKAIKVHELIVETFPEAWGMKNNLANLYSQVGRPEMALELQTKALELMPSFGGSYNNLAVTLFFELGRTAEAKRVWERSLAAGFGDWRVRQGLYWIAFLEGDVAAQVEHGQALANEPDEVMMFLAKAQTAAHQGRVEASRAASQLAVDMAERHGNAFLVGHILASSAWFEASYGSRDRALVLARKSLSTGGYRENLYDASRALALCGDQAGAERGIEQLLERFPKDTTVNQVAVPQIRAQVALDRGDSQAALEQLGPALILLRDNWDLRYTRAKALLLEGAAAQAAADLESIEFQGSLLQSPRYSTLLVDLGRARALAGDVGGSREAYEEFFVRWANADQDVPLLLEARAEYKVLSDKL